MSEPFLIVLFDGQCAFCDRWIKWIMAHDRMARLRFAPRESRSGQRLIAAHGLPPEGVESIILLEGDRISTYSTAALRIVSLLPFPWFLASALLIVPRAIRDAGYNAIAKRRLKLASHCSIPTAEQRARLLDEL